MGRQAWTLYEVLIIAKSDEIASNDASWERGIRKWYQYRTGIMIWFLNLVAFETFLFYIFLESVA